MRNPPLLAALAAFVAPAWLAPDPLVEASRVAVLAILPLGFFAVGALLAEEADEGAAPALLLGVAAPLIELPPAYLLLMAMPCGINALAVAHVYGLAVRTAAAAIAWGTALVVAAGFVAAALV